MLCNYTQGARVLWRCPVKAVVIDDSPEIVDIVSLCFKLRWPAVEIFAAHEGGKGLDLVQAQNPDIVILDLGLPDVDGYEICKQIRAFSDVPIVILTVRDSDTDVVRGLELGADDYVVKPFSHIELLARVRSVLRRSQGMVMAESEPAFVSDRLLVDFQSREVFVDGEAVVLTPIEFSLLRHLVRNARSVVTYEALLSRVWGESYLDATQVLKVHIHHLRRKLGKALGDPEVIVTQRGVGYKFMTPSQSQRPKAKSGRRGTANG
jgi:DNA-binding response OmpR family regulator